VPRLPTPPARTACYFHTKGAHFSPLHCPPGREKSLCMGPFSETVLVHSTPAGMSCLVLGLCPSGHCLRGTCAVAAEQEGLGASLTASLTAPSDVTSKTGAEPSLPACKTTYPPRHHSTGVPQAPARGRAGRAVALTRRQTLFQRAISCLAATAHISIRVRMRRNFSTSLHWVPPVAGGGSHKRIPTFFHTTRAMLRAEKILAARIPRLYRILAWRLPPRRAACDTASLAQTALPPSTGLISWQSDRRPPDKYALVPLPSLSFSPALLETLPRTTGWTEHGLKGCAGRNISSRLWWT